MARDREAVCKKRGTTMKQLPVSALLLLVVPMPAWATCRQAGGESKARKAPESIDVPLMAIGRRFLS